MPTGYTAPLYEGKDISFEEFALGCARAFGALVTMRDDPTDAPIPDEFEPTSYHVKQIASAHERLKEAQGWSTYDADRAAQVDYDARLAAHLSAEREGEERTARYEAMLERVRGWSPPSADHTGLADFMEQQLVESIRFDCYSSAKPKRVSGEVYRHEVCAKAHRDIEYHERENAREIERASERTRWIRELRDSLTGAAVT